MNRTGKALTGAGSTQTGEQNRPRPHQTANTDQFPTAVSRAGVAKSARSTAELDLASSRPWLGRLRSSGTRRTLSRTCVGFLSLSAAESAPAWRPFPGPSPARAPGRNPEKTAICDTALGRAWAASAPVVCGPSACLPVVGGGCSASAGKPLQSERLEGFRAA